jgi:hypothetical protein
VRIIGADTRVGAPDDYVKASDKLAIGGTPIAGITGVDAGVAADRWRFPQARGHRKVRWLHLEKRVDERPLGSG